LCIVIAHARQGLKYMALEQEFQKRAGETIENYLRILNGAFPNGQSLADTWKYEHEDGFMYGLIIGQLDRLIGDILEAYMTERPLFFWSEEMMSQ
jgi:hypothetical protein